MTEGPYIKDSSIIKSYKVLDFYMTPKSININSFDPRVCYYSSSKNMFKNHLSFYNNILNIVI